MLESGCRSAVVVFDNDRFRVFLFRTVQLAGGLDIVSVPAARERDRRSPIL